MGSFFGNIHLRQVDAEAVVAAAEYLGVGAAYLTTEPRFGWASLFPSSSDRDAHLLAGQVVALSGKLGTTAIAFSVFDSDVLSYWLADSGTLLDAYCSNALYPDAGLPVGGKVPFLVERSEGNATVESVEEILRPPLFAASDWVTRKLDAQLADVRRMYGPASPEGREMERRLRESYAHFGAASGPPQPLMTIPDRLTKLAGLLKIEPRLAMTGFKYITDEPEPDCALCRIGPQPTS